MSHFTDEMLMAYADGALPPEEAARIAAALESDAEARATVESFRRTAALSHAAFADVANEPVPDALVRTVTEAKTPPATVTNIAGARRPAVWRTALPLAAGIALVLGIGAALFLRQMTDVVPRPLMALGPVPPGTTLAQVLERQASGRAVALQAREAQGAAHVMVVATFRDRSARICREVETLDTTMQPTRTGVACRDPANGAWNIEGMVRLTSTTPRPDRDFVPSGAQEKDALDGLLGILGATKALPAAEEQRLLTNGWR